MTTFRAERGGDHAGTIVADQSAADAVLLLPDSEEAFVRHYSLVAEEIEIISRYRTPETRLAFALQLCVLRYPGRILRRGEIMPMHLLAFIAEQVGVPRTRSAALPAGRKPDTSTSPHCESASASRIWPIPARPN